MSSEAYLSSVLYRRAAVYISTGTAFLIFSYSRYKIGWECHRVQLTYVQGCQWPSQILRVLILVCTRIICSGTTVLLYCCMYECRAVVVDRPSTSTYFVIPISYIMQPCCAQSTRKPMMARMDATQTFSLAAGAEGSFYNSASLILFYYLQQGQQQFSSTVRDLSAVQKGRHYEYSRRLLCTSVQAA